MYKRWLIVCTFIVDLLRWCHILPNVWYQCEIDLAELRAEEWADFLIGSNQKRYR